MQTLCSFLKKTAPIFFLLIFSSFALAQAARINFQADYVSWFRNPPSVTGKGKVSLEYEDIRLEADFIKVNLKTLDLEAEGKVNLSIGTRRLKGKSLKYNLKKREGEVLSPEGKEGPILYKAQRVNLMPEKVELSGADVTTCDFSPPHYKIKAKTIMMDFKEEVIVARNATLYVGRYPLFWAPVIVRYLHRENRIMMPSIGYSDFSGWYVKTGYYYYISPRLYGTFHLDWREKKGFAEGIDASYRMEKGEGEIRTYFIKEKDTQNERWRLKLAHNYRFSRSTSLKINFDRVSDAEFLEDYFPEEDEEIPPSFLSLEHRKPAYNVNFLLEPEVNPFNYQTSIQRLPSLTLSFSPQKIGKTGLYLGKGMEATSFKKGEEEFLRTDAFADLSYPFYAFRYLKFQPKAGYHLFWYRDREGKEAWRRIPYQEIVVSSSIKRGTPDRWEYQLEPSVGWYHSSEERDDFTLPFDLEEYEKKTEDIHPPNLIKLGIKNSFYYKGKSFSSGNLTIGYNLTEEKKGFSFLEGEFYLTPPFPFLNYAKFYFYYDFYDEEYEKLAHSLDLKGKMWHLNLGLKKDVDEGINDFTIQADVNLGRKWKVSGYGKYDLIENQLSEERYTIWRDLHCWGVQLSYQRKPETDYSIMFYIKAFPQYWIKF